MCSRVVERWGDVSRRVGGGCVWENCSDDSTNGVKMVENLPGIL